MTRTCPESDRQAHLDALQDCYAMLKKDSTNPRWYRAIARHIANIWIIDLQSNHDSDLLSARMFRQNPLEANWPTPEIPDWHPLHPDRNAKFLQRIKDASILRGDPLPPQKWSVPYLEDDSRNPIYAIEWHSLTDWHKPVANQTGSPFIEKVDIQALLKEQGRLLDLPEIERFFTFTQRPMFVATSN